MASLGPLCEAAAICVVGLDEPQAQKVPNRKVSWQGPGAVLEGNQRTG